MVDVHRNFWEKKVEAREMKIATIVALLHPFVILLVQLCPAICIHIIRILVVASEGGWLNNPSFHGLSEQLYEVYWLPTTVLVLLGDNTYFWNYSCGIVLILSRFIPIIGQVAIAGLLAQKKFIPRAPAH